MYKKIKRFYDLGLYTKNHVADFVKKGVLTTDQYREITGEDYGAV